MGHFPSTHRRIRPMLAGQDGIALLMVLVVITILTTLVVSFIDTTQKHLLVTQYYKNRLKAYWAAQSGIQTTVALLRLTAQAQPQGSADGATSPWHYESDTYQQLVPFLLANVFCESSMFEPALVLTETNTMGADLGLSRTPSAVPLLDENRKMSIFGLVEGIGTVGERTDQEVFNRLEFLLQYLLKESDFVTEEEKQSMGISFGLEEERRIDPERAKTLAGYLVDWMDTENNKETGDFNPDTAEQGCPADGLPYEAKNGLLDSIDEIGLVCGFRQLPRTTIQRLTRHLTAYDLKTNINTATLPVLHAFCAANTGEVGETSSKKIYQLLHYVADKETVDIIQSQSDYGKILEGLGTDLITYLGNYTGFASTHFQIGIYGVVRDTETGTELARCRLQMDLMRRAGGNQFDLLYYRED